MYFRSMFQLVHSNIVDTVIVFPNRERPRQKHSLRELVKQYLLRDIQRNRKDPLVNLSICCYCELVDVILMWSWVGRVLAELAELAEFFAELADFAELLAELAKLLAELLKQVW